jgi:GMP reductase
MIRIIEDTKLDYSDVLLVPQSSGIHSRADVYLTTNTFGPSGIPIIAANMDGVGTFKMAEALSKHGLFTALVKHYSVEDLVRFYTDRANADIIPYTIYSMGANEADLAKYEAVLEGIQLGGDNLEAQTEPHIVCIDAANGYTEYFREFVSRFKESSPSTMLIAGNVCDPSGVRSLILYGADFVKVGVGPGSVCTTRLVAGVGYPQLSAVLECSEAALEADGAIIADGGCTCPGDVVKAFAAGATGVMLGGMLAGHEEGYEGITPIGSYSSNTHPATTGKVGFYGMASRVAQTKHNGGVKDYRSSEGREVTIPYRGRVEHTVNHILGGLRSACAYTGAKELRHLPDVAEFIKVRRQVNEVFVK